MGLNSFYAWHWCLRSAERRKSAVKAQTKIAGAPHGIACGAERSELPFCPTLVWHTLFCFTVITEATSHVPTIHTGTAEECGFVPS